jgi:hypothetical protein
MKRKQLFPITVGLFLLAVASCSPSLPDYIEDYDLVYTTYDKTYDFNTVNTYFLPDSVVHVDGSGGTTGDHTYDAQILQTIETNLNALGWTRKSESAGSAADVVVLPAVQRQTNASCAMYCWYCYWGWYPGWPYYPYSYDPAWGWYYPTDVVCSSYNTGTLVVTIVDPTESDVANKQLGIQWMGIANGLLEGSNIGTRITTNINQMFAQSPYLK